VSARAGERAALFIITEVLSGTHFADAQLKAFSGLDGASIRAATAYSRMTIENIIWVDHVLKSYIRMDKTRPYLKNILRLGTARCLFGHEDSAAVNGSVELAKELGKKGQPGFINGVLRRILREKEAIMAFTPTNAKELGLRYSFVEYAANQLVSMLGFEDAKKLMQTKSSVTTIRINPLKTTADAALTELKALGYEASLGQTKGMLTVENGGGIAASAPFTEGRISLMGTASRVASGFVGPNTKHIIDVCAAPGGKSCAMAEDHPDATVHAMDVSVLRLEQMAAQVKRLGLNNIALSPHDGQRIEETLVDSADLVLVDAPCSGLGTFLNRPEVKSQKPKQDVRELHYIQGRILSASAKYVKKGGRLVYTTCTFTKDENESAIRSFLKREKDFRLVNFENPYLTESMKERYQNGQLRLWSHLDGTDCFFIATMERT